MSLLACPVLIFSKHLFLDLCQQNNWIEVHTSVTLILFCHKGFRGYFKLKLLPSMTHFFFKNLFYQSNYKEAMKIVGGQIRGALFNFFVAKKCPFLYLPDDALIF